MASYPLIGKKTMYIDDFVVGPDFIQDEVGTITLTPGTTEVASQSGTINVPNGSYEEMSFELNILCPSVRFLGYLFPELWHSAKFKRIIAGQVVDTGQLRFGAAECISNTPRDIRIHNVCDGESSAQDIDMPACLVSAGGEFTVSLSDPFVVTLTGAMTSTDKGAVVMGEADLDTPSYYDEDQGRIVASSQTITMIAATPATITGDAGTTATVKVTAGPEGATGDITATPATPATATALDNGDGTYTVNLLAQGSTTITFKSGEAQAVVNVTVNADE